MAVTGNRFEIRSGDYRAEIAEVGANLAGLWFADRPLTVASPPDALPVMSAGAVLVPWPNRIRDGRYAFDGLTHQLPLSEPAKHNASHGLARWERWERVEPDPTGSEPAGSNPADSDPASVELALDLVPQTGFEFELRLRLSYTLRAATGLTATLQVSNIGAGAAPFGAGFHPYLELNGHDIDHAEVSIPAASMVITDEQQIPVQRLPVADTPYDLRTLRPLGTLRLDHGFADLSGSQALVQVGGNKTQLWWDESFHHLQVFTPPLQRFGRTAIAVEPMSCPADAFNSGDGLIRLEPGASWTGSWGIRDLG